MIWLHDISSYPLIVWNVAIWSSDSVENIGAQVQVETKKQDVVELLSSDDDCMIVEAADSVQSGLVLQIFSLVYGQTIPRCDIGNK